MIMMSKIKSGLQMIMQGIGLFLDIITWFGFLLTLSIKDPEELSVHQYAFQFILGLIVITVMIALGMIIIGGLGMLLANDIARLVLYCILGILIFGLVVAFIRIKVINKLS